MSEELAIHTATSLSRQTRNAVTAILALLAVFGLGMAVVRIDGAVVGTGHLGVESKVKHVTHPSGGVIAQIYVRNGARVKAGDPLIRLDDTVSGQQSSLATLTVNQMLSQRARLEAERLGASRVVFPAELLAMKDPGAAQAIADERRLFNERQVEQQAINSQLRTRIVQFRRQISGLQAQISSYKQQQVLIAPELEGIRNLWSRGLVTITRKNDLERTAVSLGGQIASLEAEIAQVEARITEAEEQIIQIAQTRRAEAGAQLSSINATLNDQQLRGVAASDVQNRTIIRAVYSGTIDKLAFASVGEVVRPAELIMDIVPVNDQLIVEGSVSPAEIEQVHQGQTARIRLSSLNASTTPELIGKVIFVAPDQTYDVQSRTSFFAVRVEIAPQSRKQGAALQMRPGMPAEIFIETGRRSMLSYVLKPLRDQFARAFRDS